MSSRLSARAGAQTPLTRQQQVISSGTDTSPAVNENEVSIWGGDEFVRV